MRRRILFAAAVVAVLTVGAELPAADCPCKCPCVAGKACDCAKCQCPNCPGKAAAVYGEITRRCKAGEVFVREVKAGEVPGVPAGVHRWYGLPDGNIRCDFWVGPNVPAVQAAPPIRYAPTSNPFIQGCATGQCAGTR